MYILTGNLTIKQMEKQLGVEFTQETIDYMKPRRQIKGDDVEKGKWRCFYPLNLMCGDKDTATKIIALLAPLAKHFKYPLPISLAP